MPDRKMPVRSREIELSGDWAGWRFTGRINPPMQAISDIMSGRYDLIIAGLTEVVLDWNFVDEKGNPLPNPAEIHAKAETDEKRKKELYRAIAKIPIDLAVEMGNALGNALAELPPN